ncbi:MAG: cellulase family glycosylhydrolase [Kouleothrix sp.]|nr:cellulase family glycosylhydrolase [Kouleothrix sp.]
MRRHILATVLLLALSLSGLSARSALAAPRCFPEAAPAISDCIDGRVADYWAAQGGLAVFGYPIGAERQEQTSVGAITAQPFERARLELHPANRAPYDVLLGRLGAELLARQGRDWTTFPKGDPAAPHYFGETGHAIAPQFWPFWSGHGVEFDGRAGAAFNESLALFGMPISEPQVEVNPSDGKSYLTQWFERARFEHHPENAGTDYEVLLGLLQRELTAFQIDAAGPPAAPPNLQPGGFIQASGAQLTRLGQPVVIKGVNYYPQWRPWSEMWTGWDGAQAERELRLARDQLGVNVVRVMLPYNFERVRNGDGKVNAKVIGRLRELAQVAGSLDMRVIVTLFDFSHDFPDAGTAKAEENTTYLRALIPPFADDDRIMAWDLHNEPDHYETWQDGDAQKVLGWLGRIADEVHALAPKQLVTVGMGQHSSLWLAGPDGRRPIDYSDVVSMHTYDAGAVAREIDELRAHTPKPILIEEFGWPTGPTCVENYTEATQQRLYHEVLTAAKDRTSGVVAWTLRDYDPARTKRWDSREEHFGLYRADGSLKPAAQELSVLKAAPLPSATVTNVSLTSIGGGFPEDDHSSPVQIAGSGHYVKGPFRVAWNLLGGQASFGRPLTEAYIRPSDGSIVQYFEGAMLEYHSGAASDLKGITEAEQTMRLIKPIAIGNAYIAGRSLGPAAVPQGALLSFYDSINGKWRLGAPISGELAENRDGVALTVQYFEKGSLELNQATGAVGVGALGVWALDAQCRASQ